MNRIAFLSCALVTIVFCVTLGAPIPVFANASGVPVPSKPKFDSSSPSAYGLGLARYAEQYDSGWIDAYSKSKMTLFDARGDSVQRAVTQKILERDEGDKSMVRFMSPAEIRGVAALIHEHPKATDDSWLYLPSSRRVRRVSGANRTASFQGTEFTYEDLSTLIVSRYDWKFLSKGSVSVDGKKESVLRLEARPNYKNTAYSRLEIDLNQDQWRPERIVYYDKAGKKLKTLTNSKWKHIHRRFWRALKVEMANHQTRKRTVINSSAVFLNLALYKKKDGSARANLGDHHFTRRALEKGR